MSIYHDILTHNDFNRITRKLDRNLRQYDPRFIDDDNFLQIEAMMMGLEFDCDDVLSTYLDEEYQDFENAEETQPEDESANMLYYDLAADY